MVLTVRENQKAGILQRVSEQLTTDRVYGAVHKISSQRQMLQSLLSRAINSFKPGFH